jgi:RNA polymerase sigma-70 factor (ECF subfamily)
MQIVALRIVRNESDAADVVQDAFIQACRGLKAFRAQSQLGTWLHRITVNAALMKLRARRRTHEQSIDEMLPTFAQDGHRNHVRPAWEGAADELLQREEMRMMVRRNIDRLPESYRLVLMLRDIDEMSTDETAAVLKIKPGAVKTRLHRARMALRGLLENELVSA